MEKRLTAGELGVVYTIASQLSTESCIRPSKVRSRSGAVVLIADKVDKLITLGLIVGLDVTVLNEVVSDLRVVPATPDGRLCSSVVLIQKFLVLFSLEFSSLGAALKKHQYNRFRVNKGSPWTKPKGMWENLHDTFRDQPIPHLTVRPFGVGSVLGIVIIILHEFQKLLPSCRLGVDDTMLNKPFMNSASGPSLVKGVGNLQISDTDIVEKSSTSSRLGSGDNIVFFEPCSELVIVPGGENIVLGVVKGPLDCGRSLSSLIDSSGIVLVGGRGNGRCRLSGGLAIGSGGCGRKTAIEVYKELCL